jgi:competence protein ComEA
LQFLGTRVIQVVLAAAIVASLSGGVILVVKASTGGGIEIVLPVATAQVPLDFKVYITGAVNDPGVYEVREGSRLVDVIAAAGGATEDADLDAINLAARVGDGEHWYLPKLGLATVAEVSVPAAQSSGGLQSDAASQGRIDLNSASASDMEALPGIGQVKAGAIVAYREANGPFESVEAVVDVTGIGPSTLEAIRDLVEAR